jgi:hypothetical protein
MKNDDVDKGIFMDIYRRNKMHKIDVGIFAEYAQATRYRLNESPKRYDAI